MNDPIELPAYPDEDLAVLSPAKLADILIEDEDRVPRNVINECARRGDEMTEYLRQLHEDDFLWNLDADDLEDVADGIWWLRLHAVMILGQIPGEQAGLLLVEFMRRISREDDENLQDWLAGFWVAQFLNKPDSILPALRDLCEEREMDWYMRANALDPYIAAAVRQGGEALEQALAWLAKNSADKSEDWEYRLNSAALLLHFPRPQYRLLLEDLAAQQSGWGMHFDKQSIEQAYTGKYLAPEWELLNNPLQFYEPDAITKRQIRWQEEDAKENQHLPSGDAEYPADPYDPYYSNEPYLRPEPKTGRNAPCPCGSGKKYKKCCLAKE
jgi:hypothetical protein